MFAWDVEGRIGMVVGLWDVRDQTSCLEDFTPVLLLGAGARAPISVLCSWERHTGTKMQTGL